MNYNYNPDAFPESAKPFYYAKRNALAEMDRHALEMLAMNLLQKRECDGLNGRHWDAGRHLYFEKLIAMSVALNLPDKTE